MMKWIGLGLLAAGLCACSINEANIPKDNGKEPSQTAGTLAQHRSADSLKIAQVEKEIALYRQALANSLTELTIVQKRMELAQSGASASKAEAEAILIRKQALQTQNDRLQNPDSLLTSYVSDSHQSKAPDHVNSSVYEEEIKNVEAEIAAIKSYLLELEKKVKTINTKEVPQ